MYFQYPGDFKYWVKPRTVICGIRSIVLIDIFMHACTCFIASSNANLVSRECVPCDPTFQGLTWWTCIIVFFWMHTIQEKWIQMELAFTLAENATKPNPFEIIPLQTTWKENNWKTKETLARAVVTLEMEWIKGSSLQSLWWWWFEGFTLWYFDL